MHFMQIGNWELVISSTSTVDELHVTLYFASLAASPPEIWLRKVQKYDCSYEKTVVVFTSGV